MDIPCDSTDKDLFNASHLLAFQLAEWMSPQVYRPRLVPKNKKKKYNSDESYSSKQVGHKHVSYPINGRSPRVHYAMGRGDQSTKSR
jgi:hypothetical protein